MIYSIVLTGPGAGRHVLPEVWHHLRRLAGPGAEGQALGREAPLTAQVQEGQHHGFILIKLYSYQICQLFYPF